VFGISEGGTYGWWQPLRTFTLGGADVWPKGIGVSVVPVAFVLALLLLVGFHRVERFKERERRDPLFEFGHLRHLGFRYGLATLVVLAMGQTAFLLVISVFLQDSRHLSALDTGMWLVPSGVFIVAGSQLGSRLTQTIGTTAVVRWGLALEAAGLGATAVVVGRTVGFLGLLPGFALFGVGIGFAGSQLTNVILSDIPAESSGAASGANSTVRMIGSSLGVAIMSTLLSVFTVRYAVDVVERAKDLSRAVQVHAVTQLHRNGVNFAPRKGTSAHDMSLLERALTGAIASAARPPLIFATAVVALGFGLSFLIPRVGPHPEGAVDEAEVDAAQEAELFAEAVTIR
jgi:hypothetical protein